MTESNYPAYDPEKGAIPAKLLRWAMPVMVLIGLSLTRLHSFLLFHSLAEAFSIIIACGVFMIAWNARGMMQNHYLLFIGIAYLYVGGIDLLHTLSYRGMGIFEADADIPTQLWIAGRYMEAFSLFLAIAFLRRKINPYITMAVFGLTTALLLCAIFYWKIFPASFVEGSGLTPFKIYSEYAICLILALVVGLLIHNAEAFDRRILRLLVFAVALTIAQELAFTLYQDVYGAANTLGHILKIAAFYLVYRAVIFNSLVAPYNLLFRDLKQNLTHQKELEKELREKEERLRLFINYAPVSLAMFDRDMHYLSYSRRWLEDYRLGEQDLIGRSHYDVFPEVSEQWKDIHKKCLGGEILNAENDCFVRSDGTVQWLRWEVRPWHDAGGNIGGIVIFTEDRTDRKLAEDALRESEERFRTVFRVIPDALAVTSPDGHHLEINAAYTELLGYSRDEVIGKTTMEIDLWPDQQEWKEFRTLLSATDRVRNFEGHLKTRSGEIRTMLLSVDSLEMDGLPGTIALIKDISDRKQMEESLRVNESRFRLLSKIAGRLLETGRPAEAVSDLCGEVMEHLGCHVFFNFLLDENVKKLHLNAWAGIPAEEAARIEWLDIGEAICGCAAQTGERIVVENIFHAGDLRADLVKSYGIQAYAAHPIYAHGKVIGTLSFGTRSRTAFSSEDLDLMRIVTDQVAIAMERVRLIGQLETARDELEQRVRERTSELAGANQALLESEKKFRLIAETVQDVFWMQTPGSGKMTYVSPAFEKIWGVTLEELETDPNCFTRSIHAEDLPAVLSSMADAVFNGGSGLEYRIIRPDESLRWISHRSYPVKDKDGRTERVVGVASDITARKNAEERLRRYSLDLERANRDLSDFNYIATHHLQEPLRLLMTLSDLLASIDRGKISPEGEDVIFRIQRAARRASVLIRDIHRYSMASSRNEPFRKTDMNMLVREALSDFKDKIAETNADIEIGNLPVLEIAREQMTDVFKSLISNALKFTGQSQPRIRISGQVGLNEKQARIIVKDNGIGFDETYLDKIFTPFQTLQGRDRYEGSGIGLAYCRKVLERHGGGITAKSGGSDNGATFIITLPVRR